MNNVDLELTNMTRKEYYLSQGLSGSEIDRPDDPVDNLFIEHVNSLKSIMETLISNSKSGVNCTFIEDKKVNKIC